ncbi:hypothetical protein BRYFOR_06137 [Marvinbryantia formatexigens DSM 14469]|uniref:Uncharacterized protein n=1 Tax=Marvinbryantia formatexigens DSM 14469 TaxID=478749 RepID=C6LBZ0_9FIRM|nr:hypothetical protein BRYFOR_06137 [Marvinbryantia formatexigens DSM 14469]
MARKLTPCSESGSAQQESPAADSRRHITGIRHHIAAARTRCFFDFAAPPIGQLSSQTRLLRRLRHASKAVAMLAKSAKAAYRPGCSYMVPDSLS